MRRRLRYVLVTDGSSDACLLRPIQWLLAENGWRGAQGRWADLRLVPDPGTDLAQRLRLALALYPSDVLFVHRDSEAAALASRIDEIERAVAAVGVSVPHVCIVPVRMTEAWLLHDESAIRGAAGKPKGRTPLRIPAGKRLEQLADPKSILRDALLTASEASGERLRKKRKEFGSMRYRVAELITDYAPLRALEAFRRFEHDLQQVLEGR